MSETLFARWNEHLNAPRARNRGYMRPTYRYCRTHVRKVEHGYHPVGSRERTVIQIETWGNVLARLYRDGGFAISTGGNSRLYPSYRNRIEAHTPARFAWDDKLKWYVRTRPNERDPEPHVRRRSVLKPFYAPDPGPEPVKNSIGCIAHTTQTLGDEFAEEVWDEDTGEYVWKDKIITYTPGRTNSYREPDTKQCPHCAEHDRIHTLWCRGYYGADWTNHPLDWAGYATYKANVDRFGSFAAWRQAYLAEYRRERKDRKAWRVWLTRNSAPIAPAGEVTCFADGYATRKSANEAWATLRRVERQKHRRIRELKAAQARDGRLLDRKRKEIDRMQKPLIERARKIKARRRAVKVEIARALIMCMALERTTIELNDISPTLWNPANSTMREEVAA